MPCTTPLRRRRMRSNSRTSGTNRSIIFAVGTTTALVGTGIHVPHDALQPGPFGKQVTDGSVEFRS